MPRPLSRYLLLLLGVYMLVGVLYLFGLFEWNLIRYSSADSGSLSPFSKNKTTKNERPADSIGVEYVEENVNMPKEISSDSLVNNRKSIFSDCSDIRSTLKTLSLQLGSSIKGARPE